MHVVILHPNGQDDIRESVADVDVVRAGSEVTKLEGSAAKSDHEGTVHMTVCINNTLASRISKNRIGRSLAR